MRIIPDPDTSKRRKGKTNHGTFEPQTYRYVIYTLLPFLLEGEISTLIMTYIQLTSLGWDTSSFLAEIGLVGLEEFARLVGERLGREGEW